MLEEKWKAFGKRKYDPGGYLTQDPKVIGPYVSRLRQQFAAFCLYFLCFFTAFYYRPMRSREYYENIKQNISKAPKGLATQGSYDPLTLLVLADPPSVCMPNTTHFNETQGFYDLFDENMTIPMSESNTTTQTWYRKWCTWECYLWVIEDDDNKKTEFIVRVQRGVWGGVSIKWVLLSRFDRFSKCAPSLER